MRRTQELRQSAATLLVSARGDEDGRPVIAKGKGAVVTDVDGHSYIDYDGAAGSLILGHADERVVVAVSKAVAKGGDLSLCSEARVRLAEMVVAKFSSIDRLHFVHSHADALCAAVRIARALTNRRCVVASDAGVASEGGVVPYGDLDAVTRLFDDADRKIAAVIVEPVTRMGGLSVVPVEYLRGVRTMCDDHGALLVCDAGVAAFRQRDDAGLSPEGAAPDLMVHGPVLGGGEPLAAVGGSAGLFDRLASKSLVWDGAGVVLGGVGMAAGLAVQQAMAESDFYDALEAKTAKLEEGLRAAVAACGVPAEHARFGNLLGLSFTAESFESPTGGNAERVTQSFQRLMLNRGVYLPAASEVVLAVSSAHSDEQIEQTIDIVHEVLGALGQ